jgi:hypothetical protein
VDPVSPAGFAGALNLLLGDHGLRREIGRRAYAYGRGMVWPAVGARYRELFAEVAGGAYRVPLEREAPAPQVLAAARG